MIDICSKMKELWGIKYRPFYMQALGIKRNSLYQPFISLWSATSLPTWSNPMDTLDKAPISVQKPTFKLPPSPLLLPDALQTSHSA